MRARTMAAGAAAALALGLAPAVALAPAASATTVPASPTAATSTPAATAPTAVPATVRPPATAYPLRAGDTGRLVTGAQVRLAWAGYAVKPTGVMDRATMIAVAKFRAKFRLGATRSVTAKVAARLRAVTRAKGVLPAACLGRPMVLCIDKTQRVLRVVRNGTVTRVLDARFGSESHATREGTFRVYWKSRDHVSSLYRTPMPYAMFFSGGQAVHFSRYFRRDGYAGASHGCVNLRDLTAAKKLFASTPRGTRVVVYSS